MNEIKISNIKPVKKVSITEMVAEQIISMIKKGDLKPGDKLPSQKELEKMLGISRPSLREAMAGLITLGYIEARAGQGYYVCKMEFDKILDFSIVAALISDETIAQLFEARLFLETYLTKLAANRATQEDIQKLGQYIDEIEKGLPAENTIITGLEFHQLVADSVHNPVLSKIEKTLLASFEEYAPRIFCDTPSYDFDVKDHRSILERIAAHDPKGAGEMAFKHIREFADELGLSLDLNEFETPLGLQRD